MADGGLLTFSRSLPLSSSPNTSASFHQEVRGIPCLFLEKVNAAGIWLENGREMTRKWLMENGWNMREYGAYR